MPIIGLEPEYPPPITEIVVFHPKHPTIDSLQPTFRWKPFPRDKDVRAYGKELMGRVRDVTYDLRVWRSSKCQVWTWLSRPFAEATLDYVYSKDGLPSPVHQLEILLLPSAHYCWTVSAKFTIDGHPRATERSRQSLPLFREEYAYGFRAPAQ